MKFFQKTNFGFRLFDERICFVGQEPALDHGECLYIHGLGYRVHFEYDTEGDLIITWFKSKPKDSKVYVIVVYLTKLYKRSTYGSEENVDREETGWIGYNF